mmetsp:Transcript_29464/g.83099  ORF Transcript_29464/g.83099 Transcript_29464/m.83099 type:complete len:241 (-) Transcript_29464:66-788(-)
MHIQRLPSLWAVLLVGVAALFPQETLGNFQEGEFVPTARRAQFDGKRTHWHDLLGRHCPRFGIDKVVAVPLPRPTSISDVTLSAGFEYKLALSFDGDRHHTAWLTIIGRKWKGVPFIEVELVRSGAELRKIRSEVTVAPRSVVENHKQLDEEFRNATHWPKHLLVRYRWTTISEVDVDNGLYVLFGSGLLVTAIVAFSVARTYQAKLTQFLSDMAAEEFAPEFVAGQPSGGFGPPPAKAD